MFKKSFFWGLAAGLVTAAATIVFQQIHEYITYSSFQRVVNISSLIGISLLAGMMAAIGYFTCTKWFGKRGELIFNFAFAILTFISILVPYKTTLPLDMEFPELFPSLVIPMHFFPALAWHTLRPFFTKTVTPSAN